MSRREPAAVSELAEGLNGAHMCRACADGRFRSPQFLGANPAAAEMSLEPSSDSDIVIEEQLKIDHPYRPVYDRIVGR